MLSEQPNERGFATILSNRNFLRLWIAEAIVLACQNGIHFVQMVLIEQLTGSTTQMGVMILAFSIPGVLFSAVAGIVVDRLPKKLVLDVSNVLRVVTVIGYVVALRLLDGWQVLLALYLVTFVISSISQFFAPALWSTVPLVVGEDRLLASNTLFNVTAAIAQAAGMVLLAPLAVKLVGIEGSFIGIAILYAVNAVLLGGLRTGNAAGSAAVSAAQEPTGSRRSQDRRSQRRARRATLAGPRSRPGAGAWTDLREGWRFIVAHHGVYMPMAQLTLIATLLMVLAMVAPGFATRILGMKPEDAVTIFAPAGLGMLVSSIVLGRFSRLLQRETWVNLSLAGTAMGFGLLGWVSVLRVSARSAQLMALGPAHFSVTTAVIGIAMLIGFCMATVNTVSATALQERSPAAIRGRVLAVQFLLANLVGIPPLIGLGSVADTLGIPWVCFILAVLVAVLWAGSVVNTQRLQRSEARAVRADDIAADQRTGRARVLILAGPLGTGTRAADALCEAFGSIEGPAPRVERIDGMALLPGALRRAGAVARRTAWIGRLSRRAALRSVRALQALAGPALKQARLCYEPDVILCLQPLFGPLLAHAGGPALVVVVTERAWAHPLWFVPQADLTVVATEAALEAAIAAGVDRERVWLLGLPTAPRDIAAAVLALVEKKEQTGYTG